MKKSAYKHRREVVFNVGDQIYLKLQSYHFCLLASRPNKKLSPQFYGLFAITDKIRQVTYRLKLSDLAKIHSVFHVSQLKKQIGFAKKSQPLLEGLSEERELVVQPKTVLKYRHSPQGDLKLLIQWKQLSNYECSWESYDNIRRLFSQLHLGGKVPLDGRGNIRTKVYTRKRER